MDLRWRDVSLAARKLRVVQAKTDAGVREADVSPMLAELLSEHRTPDPRQWPGRSRVPHLGGEARQPVQRTQPLPRRFGRAANVKLAGAGEEPIGKVTPPSLRRTFAPLLLATGADVPSVMAQLGHTDPKMTLGVYAKMIASKTDHGAALDGLIGAADWAPIGSTATEEGVGALNVPANRCLSAKSREFPD